MATSPVAFRYSTSKQGYGSVVNVFPKNTAAESGMSLIQMTTDRAQTFSDFEFYQSLLAKEGCQRVRISEVRCLTNEFFLGLQVIYQCTFSNGQGRIKVEDFEAPEHHFCRGHYYNTGGAPTKRTLVLDNDEYITGIRLNQGDIVDAVTFITNLREEHFGGYGGENYQMIPNRGGDDDHRWRGQKIVAFAGSANLGIGAIHRIAYFAERNGWENVGPLVMLRKLVEEDRAVHVRSTHRSKQECLDEEKLDAVLLQMIEIDSEDCFRSVLEFLI